MIKLKTINETDVKRHRRIGSLVEELTSVRAFFERNILADYIPASEIYKLIEELIEILQFVVSDVHFRTPKTVPSIKMIKESVAFSGRTKTDPFVERRNEWVPVIDELSNPKIGKKHLRKMMAVPDPEDVDGLEIILKSLITLRRNRTLSRSRIAALDARHASQVNTSQKRKRREKKGWFYK